MHKIILSVGTNFNYEQNAKLVKEILTEEINEIQFSENLLTEPIGEIKSNGKFLNFLVFGSTEKGVEQLNGQITVRDHHTKEIIYINSFSTLFQEWLTYDEAKTISKSFENVFLVPMPKDIVDVTVDLRNNRHEIVTSMTHVIAPNDILIRHTGFSYVTPYATLQTAEDTTKCIHIAYVAEGYTAEEMPIFLEDARIATEALFEHEPFKTKRNRFNIIAVKSVSMDTGTSIPSQGVWKKTVLGSHFDTFYSNRYLTTLNQKNLHDVLAGTPYEHIIVLVNTSEYGGGGILNSYNLSMTHHPLYKQVVVHEFGHSFAGLADEYAYEQEAIPMYPHDVEPWEKNITTLVNFHNKWESLIAPTTPIPTPTDLGKKANNKKRLLIHILSVCMKVQVIASKVYIDLRSIVVCEAMPIPTSVLLVKKQSTN